MKKIVFLAVLTGVSLSAYSQTPAPQAPIPADGDLPASILSWLSTFLSYPCSIPLMVPIIFGLVGGLAKKLVRSGWRWSDFYLGIEFSVAAMSSGLLNLLDFLKETPIESDTKKGIISLCFLVVTVFILFSIISLHQDWEKPGVNRFWKAFLLGGLSNLVGFGLLSAFIIVKGS